MADFPVPAEIPATLAVLIVDDEPLIRWSLRTGLTRRGHAVVEADSATRTLEVLAGASAPFDVIVLDYRLPDRRDLSLLDEVRRAVPASTVLMMTAYGDPEMRENALALGARAVVDKPFRVSDVVALIESTQVP